MEIWQFSKRYPNEFLTITEVVYVVCLVIYNFIYRETFTTKDNYIGLYLVFSITLLHCYHVDDDRLQKLNSKLIIHYIYKF